MAGTDRTRKTEMATLDPSRQAAAQVFEQLREAIVSMDLAPGTVINRGELQKRYRLSSTPIRDALLRLADEALVDIFPQSATRVSLIDVDAARQCQFLRRALELEAIETICVSADRTVTQDLRELIEWQKDAAKRVDLAAFEDLDRAFHQRIFEAAGVAELYQRVRQQSGHIDRIRRLHLPYAGKMQEVVRDHTLIVKSIAAGNPAEARQRMRDHLSHSLAYSPKLRERNPTWFKS
jgi:DNA-binding GntR family transcriptional regulator